MLIILGFYFAIIWLIFFQFRILPWSRSMKVLATFVGLVICLVVVAQLNTKAPSGRVTMMGRVIEISPSVSGRVTEVAVRANEEVAQGDLLFRIDPVPFEAAVQEASAAVQIATLTLARQQEVFDRNPGGSISQQQLDESTATLRAAEARLDDARFRLSETEVLAPTKGMASAVNLAPGFQASAGFQVIPFVDTQDTILIGVFAQNGSQALSVGTPVEIVLEAAPGRVFKTTVGARTPGSSGGQLRSGSSLLSASDIGSASDMFIVLEWPEDLPADLRSVGNVGTATAYRNDAGPIGVLAKILLWIRGMLTYI